MFGLGPSELILILLIAFLLFGAKRLPEIGEALGKAIKGFKKALSKPDEIDVTPPQEGKKDDKK